MAEIGGSMAKKHEDKVANERRNFIKMVGLGTITGGAAIATSGAVQADTLDEIEGSGYRETGHVKTYYDLARF